MLVQLLFVLFVEIAFGENVVRLKGANEFIEFSDNVTSGTNYSGTTVLLDPDLSLFGEKLGPIGYFLGVFDGQGHIISDLRINSYSELTGLFGYSKGLTIRNVVLDDSCSIANSYNGYDDIYIGGIIGLCYAVGGQCNIENSVNMAGVTFKGTINGYSYYYSLCLGGIAGHLGSHSYDVSVKNCANYGSITYSGTSYSSCIGGIVGDLYGSNYTRLYNCLNYGAITHSGTSSFYLRIGGIVGWSYYAYIEDCVSAGKISTPTKASAYNYIGNIVGYVDYDIHINYCYYTSDVNAGKINGHGTPSSIIGTPSSPTNVDSELVGKLNNNATSSNWSKWLLNTNNATVTFKMSDNKGLSFSSQVILVPNPVKEGNIFLFWCKDAKCTEEFDPVTETVSGNTTIYAAWANNTVTFDFDNGTAVNDIFIYNTTVEYPKNEDMKKEGYIFSGWDKSDIVHMPAQNITVTALWKPSNYTVTFDANGGNNLSVTSMIVTFNSTYGPLPTPTKEGHSFIGWFTDNNKSVKSEAIVSIADDHTLYAQWEKTTNQVEIVFNTKDLSKEEVEELVKKYTDAKFEITEFEEEAGEIRVIIKFINNEDAARFVRNANELSRVDGDNLIKRVGFVSDSDSSFSSLLYPTLFLTSLL